MNVNLSEDVSLRLGAMIDFYGGRTVNVHKSDVSSLRCASHALSVLYDDASKWIETEASHVKLVTPDWLVDSLLAGTLVDELPYHPKYLRNNPDLCDIIRSIETG